MTDPDPDVSVVFETENEEPNHRIRLTDVMQAWLRQTARSRVAEWIIVSPRSASPEEAALLARAPARWIERPGTRYYGLKNEGSLGVPSSLFVSCRSCWDFSHCLSFSGLRAAVCGRPPHLWHVCSLRTAGTNGGAG